MVDTARRRLLACAIIAAALPARTACAAPPLVIGCVPGGDAARGAGADTCADACADSFAGASANAIEAAAVRDGITVKFADTRHGHPQSRPQDIQVAAIRSFIAQKVSVIVLAPVADTGWDTVLREAKAAGIPVIVTGRAIAAGDPDLVATFIGPDPAAQGRRAGRWLAAQSARAPATLINIVELQGPQDSPQPLAHHQGFAQAIAGHARLRMLQSQPGGPSRASAMAAMAALLRTHGRNIGAVYAHSGEMATGAIEAIEQAGMRPGRDILVLSVGGGTGAADAMAAGKLNLAIACPPLPGVLLMQVARDILAGKRVPRWVTPSD